MWQSSNSGTAAFLVFKCVWDIEMRAWFWIVGCSVGYGFACQYAGNAARHSLTLGLARSTREPRLRGGYATSPAVAEGAWLRPRPARQSPDCRRGRVHRHASLRRRPAQLKAAAFPAQHIRSALSLAVAVSAAHRRRRRVPAGRRVRMRRDLPSPGSVGIPPIAGSAAPRLPPSASPAVTTSASCRRLAVPLRSFEAAHQYGIKFD